MNHALPPLSARDRRTAALLPALLALGAACSGMLACHESKPDRIVVSLYPGDTAFASITVDACGYEDELHTCYTEILDTNLPRADLDIISQGIRNPTQCAAQVEVTTFEDTPPGRFRLRTETEFSYYDHFFEHEQVETEVVEIWVEVLRPR